MRRWWKKNWRRPILSKLRRWLYEGAILLVLLAGVIVPLDVWRSPQMPIMFDNTPLHTLDGETITLASISEERPVLLYFWASWRNTYRFTTLDVARLQSEGKNVMTVALHSGSDGEVSRQLSRRRVTFLVVSDSGDEVSRNWEISVTPVLVMVSRGQVVTMTSDWTSYWGMKLRLWRTTMS